MNKKDLVIALARQRLAGRRLTYTGRRLLT